MISAVPSPDTPRHPSPQPAKSSCAAVLAAATVIVLAGAVAYRRSFSGAFLFDDRPAILENLTIRHLWPPGLVLAPPPHTTASGRPLVNLTLAVNYVLGGRNVAGYHVMNLLIHLLAGLALFGVVRRTLLQPGLSARFGGAALPLALAVAGLWTVHPLQTEAVTYVVQRAESLMGLFYLLTLYGFIRGVQARERSWLALSVATCLLGMGSKEVMVSAPVLVLLYDRTFVAGSFYGAWRSRRSYYLGLAATWVWLAWLVAGAGGDRGGEFGVSAGREWWAYGLTQFGALVRYFRLSVWPHPLVFDYGTVWVTRSRDVVPAALVVTALAVLTAIGLWRRTAAGFLGAWVFAILAPTSLMPGTVQMTVEHRMYLPLAAVLALLVTGAYSLVGRRGLVIAAAVGVLFAFLTDRRNATYGSDLSLWQDTVATCPGSARAHYGLGYALFDAGRDREAVEQFEEALRIDPDAQAHNDLGKAYVRTGRIPEGISEFREALRIQPDKVEAGNDLANALVQEGRVQEAVGEYRHVLRLKPDYSIAHDNLGTALMKMGRPMDGMAEYRMALEADPNDPGVHNNLGLALAGLPGRLPEAVSEYRAALAIEPDNAEAHNNLGNALNREDHLPEAMAEYRAALRIKPGYADAHSDLGGALIKAGRAGEAAAEFAETLRLAPDDTGARIDLGVALAEAGRVPDAIAQFEAVLKLPAGDTAAHAYDAAARSYLKQLGALQPARPGQG